MLKKMLPQVQKNKCTQVWKHWLTCTETYDIFGADKVGKLGIQKRNCVQVY